VTERASWISSWSMSWRKATCSLSRYASTLWSVGRCVWVPTDNLKKWTWHLGLTYIEPTQRKGSWIKIIRQEKTCSTTESRTLSLIGKPHSLVRIMMQLTTIPQISTIYFFPSPPLHVFLKVPQLLLPKGGCFIQFDSHASQTLCRRPMSRVTEAFVEPSSCRLELQVPSDGESSAF
jgi:hypothetical protein